MLIFCQNISVSHKSCFITSLTNRAAVAKYLEWASPLLYVHSCLIQCLRQRYEDNPSQVRRMNLLHNKWDAVDSGHTHYWADTQLPHLHRCTLHHTAACFTMTRCFLWGEHVPLAMSNLVPLYCCWALSIMDFSPLCTERYLLEALQF